MAEERKFWVFNQEILENLKFPEFNWWEFVLIFAVLGALSVYFLLVVYLDRRSRASALRNKQTARLDRWLEEWSLEEGEIIELQTLAGEGGGQNLYRMLSDPRRFERQVHQAIQNGGRLPFVERIRVALGYCSDNYSVPVVSTRQLLVGDHFRFVVWEGARPRHHYAMAIAVREAGITVQLTEEGYGAVSAEDAEIDLFYLRGNDMEYRFPVRIRQKTPPQHRLLLAHQLVTRGHRPRYARLPVVRPYTFQLRSELESRDDLFDEPVRTPAEVRNGVLLEMSEGGFSVILERPAAEGWYMEFNLPTPRGGDIPIRGRVLQCRPFGGNRWMVRCELRGITAIQRNMLAQILRLAWRNRLGRVLGKKKGTQKPS